MALTMATIVADALNRTLLICDRPLVELYDAEALRGVVPIQVTYFRRADIPRTGRGDAAATTWIVR